MARHGTHMVAAYTYALPSSPTEDSDNLESVYRNVESGALRMRCIHHIHACTWHVRSVLDERLIGPWYLVSYYTVDSIGYKGRTWYNIPVVIESGTNTVYTAPYKPRH